MELEAYDLKLSNWVLGAGLPCDEPMRDRSRSRQTLDGRWFVGQTLGEFSYDHQKSPFSSGLVTKLRQDRGEQFVHLLNRFRLQFFTESIGLSRAAVGRDVLILPWSRLLADRFED